MACRVRENAESLTDVIEVHGLLARSPHKVQQRPWQQQVKCQRVQCAAQIFFQETLCCVRDFIDWTASCRCRRDSPPGKNRRDRSRRDRSRNKAHRRPAKRDRQMRQAGIHTDHDPRPGHQRRQLIQAQRRRHSCAGNSRSQLLCCVGAPQALPNGQHADHAPSGKAFAESDPTASPAIPFLQRWSHAAGRQMHPRPSRKMRIRATPCFPVARQFRIRVFRKSSNRAPWTPESDCAGPRAPTRYRVNLVVEHPQRFARTLPVESVAAAICHPCQQRALQQALRVDDFVVSSLAKTIPQVRQIPFGCRRRTGACASGESKRESPGRRPDAIAGMALKASSTTQSMRQSGMDARRSPTTGRLWTTSPMDEVLISSMRGTCGRLPVFDWMRDYP